MHFKSSAFSRHYFSFSRFTEWQPELNKTFSFLPSPEELYHPLTSRSFASLNSALSMFALLEAISISPVQSLASLVPRTLHTELNQVPDLILCKLVLREISVYVQLFREQLDSANSLIKYLESTANLRELSNYLGSLIGEMLRRTAEEMWPFGSPLKVSLLIGFQLLISYWVRVI